MQIFGTGPRPWALVGGAAALSTVAWLVVQANRVPTAPSYTRDGYGGFVPSANVAVPKPKSVPAAVRPTAPALADYNAGHYQEAESKAKQVVAQETDQQETARAQWVLAFSAARRRDLKLARQRFAALKQSSAGETWTMDDPRKPATVVPSASSASSAAEVPEDVMPDRPVSPTGAPLATLEEEAAYQHAVLTQAVDGNSATATSGKKQELGKNYSPEAERELVEFMRRYPESPLVHAAVRRIGMMHGGDIPKYAERVWQDAMKAGQTRQHARDRERSLCGPEVLTEILRRLAPQGELPTVRELAKELKTDHQGTSLQSLADAAGKRGLLTKGFRLTWDGLWKLTHGKEAVAPESTKLVALIQPGHYILIEEVNAGWVTVWDPTGETPGAGVSRKHTRAEWERLWAGVVLRVSGRPAP